MDFGLASYRVGPARCVFGAERCQGISATKRKKPRQAMLAVASLISDPGRFVPG